MLFFLNLDGTVTRSDTDHVYQGQNKVANVELFTLISPTETPIKVAFTLPNGLTTTYLPMSHVGAYSVDKNNQKQVHHWKLAVPYNVTEVEGQVGVSFNIVLEVVFKDKTSDEESETINQTTYTSSFLVEYSALPIPPTTVNNDEIQQILDLLDQYYAQNASLAAKQPFVVGTVNTNTLGANQQASVAVEQSTTPDSNGNYPTNFTFSIPQGIQGEIGETPDVSAVAEVSNTVGTPSVVVEKSGSKENPVFNFKFSNIKGQKGDPGVGNANLSNTPGTSDTNGYTQKAVNGIVQNPNLLINPNFAINQRGQTSYTGTVYGVDRWKGVNANTVVMPQAVGIIVQGANFQFAQDIDNYAIIDGYTLTLSIKANGIVYSASGVYNKDVDYSFCTCVIAGGYIARIRSYQGTCRCQIIGISSGEALSIEWVKLEIGSVATEFSQPSIAEELPKCQRYYENVYATDMWGTVSGASYVVANCIFKTPKRTAPTLIIKNPMTIRYSGNNYTQTAQGTSASYRNINSAVITFNNFSGLTVGQYWWSNEKDLLVCAFDAEI